jgi:carboxypeptidase Q
MRALFALAALVISAPALAADGDAIATQLVSRASSGANVAWDMVSELTTRFGPRPAGSASERAAARWAAAKLREYGFRNVAVHDFAITGWTRGQESVTILLPHPQPLAATALGGSPATPGGAIEGEIVSFASLEALKLAAPGSLAGKIALVDLAMPKGGTGFGYGYVGRVRAFGPSEAATRGAIGFLMRSVGTDSHRLPHTGSTRYIDGKVPVPSFALSVPDADQIARLEALGERVRVRLSSTASYQPGALTSYITGDIPGSGAADEVVLLGAHLDSWDLGTGAIDDGAGVAIITAAAKLIGEQKRRPRRTIRVVFYGAEEVTQPDSADVSGRAYRDPRMAEMAKHVLAMESDEGADPIIALAVPDHLKGGAFEAAALRILGPLAIVPAREPPGRGGVDIAPLVDAGVPAFVLQQSASRYFDYHHTADDTLDKIDRTSLDQNVAAWAGLIWLAADGDTDFRPRGTAK